MSDSFTIRLFACEMGHLRVTIITVLGRQDSRSPAHSSHQGLMTKMSLQLALQRWGAPCEVAITKEPPV